MKLFRNRTFLAILSILAAALLCFQVIPQINTQQEKRVDIVRVVKDIPEGTAITEDMVRVVSVGGYNLPEDVLKDTKDAIGKYAAAELLPGDYILSSKVSDQSKTPYLSGLDEDEQAISIPINSFAAGLSGKLQSGDVISLIVSDYGSEKQTLAPAELKYVKLLATTNSEGVDTDQIQQDDDDSSQSENIPATLTLFVNPEQATALVDYESNGSLYAALVYRGSQESAQKYLDIQQDYFTPRDTSGTGGVPTDG